MKVLFKRPDGTLVIEYKDNPYQVLFDDPMFEEAKAEADNMGDSLGFEPPLVITTLPPKVDPDAAQLKIALASLGKTPAQIDALWALALAI